MLNNFNIYVHVILNCLLFVKERHKLLEDLFRYFMYKKFLLICKTPKASVWFYYDVLRIPVLFKLLLKSGRKSDLCIKIRNFWGDHFVIDCSKMKIEYCLPLNWLLIVLCFFWVFFNPFFLGGGGVSLVI